MPMRELNFWWLGRTEYLTAHRLMLELVEERIAGRAEDVVLMTEHEDVYTLGRNSRPEHLLNPQHPVHQVERAGGPTYHGPGQLVAYPVLALSEWGLDARKLVTALEEATIRALSRFGLRAGREEGKPGVWVSGRKIASIGLAIRGGVSFHGIAVNLTTDLRKFGAIMPCGMPSDVMTSLEREVGVEVGVKEFGEIFAEEFAELLGARAVVKEMPPASIRRPVF
jgi:lipoate-protein ligase B